MLGVAHRCLYYMCVGTSAWASGQARTLLWLQLSSSFLFFLAPPSDPWHEPEGRYSSAYAEEWARGSDLDVQRGPHRLPGVVGHARPWHWELGVSYLRATLVATSVSTVPTHRCTPTTLSRPPGTPLVGWAERIGNGEWMDDWIKEGILLCSARALCHGEYLSLKDAGIELVVAAAGPQTARWCCRTLLHPAALGRTATGGDLGAGCGGM